MSEDRLERALQEMKNESVDPETLAGARARVWEKLEDRGGTACAALQPEFGDYLGGRLVVNRRVLVEDHLSRCPGCRARMAELKGENRVASMPRRSVSPWLKWGTWAAAAVVLMGALYLGRHSIDAMLAPGGPPATVVSADRGLYRLPEGMLEAGAAISEGERVRTGPGGRALLRLADGSKVEVNERTELFVTAAWSGQTVHLQRGDIIVEAAKQRRGSLRVQTRDSLASVKGTVFAVSSGLGGSVVSVVEGSVAVAQPGAEMVLSPGQQAASNPALASSVQDAVAWSPEAEIYIALLGSVARIERQMAEMPPAELRMQPRLLPYLPAASVIYGAVPNLGGTIDRAAALAEEQSAENPAFNAWWNSEAGLELRQMIDRIQTATPLLGEEIVFCASSPDSQEEIPLVLARVQPGRQAELTSALDELFVQAGETSRPYSVFESLMVVSDSQQHLQWVLDHLGQGADTPFAAAIADRYRRGAGWLVGMDVAPALSTLSGTEAVLTGAGRMKYLFLEQRGVRGAEENEVTLVFQGPRMGMASWLADTGSGGAAEYLPAGCLFAAYVSTREPRQLFEEFVAQITRTEPSFERDLSEMDAKLGPGFAEKLAAALGTESAFALEGFSVSGPVWVMAALANDPPAIDDSLLRLVEAFNEALPPESRDKQIAVEQESAGGRNWTTLKPGGLPFSITWTYDRGYMVAASDRGAATRAIATREGGSPLIWSPEFLQQLPASAGMHPSAFAWLNTGGALQIFAALAPSPALRDLMSERNPILAVFDGSAEQIHAASRTRISGLIVDLMLLESLGRARSGLQVESLRQ